MDIEVIEISQLVDQPQGTVIKYLPDGGCNVVLVEEAKEVKEAPQPQAGASNQDVIKQPECSRSFSDGQIMTVASGYQCSVCDLISRRLVDAKAHNRMHTGEPLHQCNVCMKQFARINTLERHVLSHMESQSDKRDVFKSLMDTTPGTVVPNLKQDNNLTFSISYSTSAEPVVSQVTQPCNTNVVTSDPPISYVINSDTLEPVVMEISQPSDTNAVSVTNGAKISYITTGDTMKPVVPEVVEPGSSGAVLSGRILVEGKQDLSSVTATQAVITSLQNKRLGVRNHEDRTAHFIKMIDGYQCSACPLKFKLEAHAKVHIRTHTRETPYSCTVCAKKYTRKSYLADHMKTHWDGDKNDPRSHACDVCNRRFMHRNHLTQHLIVHTREKVKKIRQINSSGERFACDKCSTTFGSWKTLRKHVLNIHLKRKPHQCVLCKKAFPSIDRLNNHIACHRKDCQYPCSQCINRFSMKSKLNKHMMQHTKGKAFCPKCGWRGRDKETMQDHLTDCAGLTYLCTHCRVEFNTLETYQAHVDELIVECKQCDRGVVMKLESRDAAVDSDHVAVTKKPKKAISKPRNKTAVKWRRKVKVEPSQMPIIELKPCLPTTATQSQNVDIDPAASRTRSKIAIIDVKGTIKTPTTRSQKAKIPGTSIIREVIDVAPDEEDDDESVSDVDTIYDDDDDDDDDYHGSEKDDSDESIAESGSDTVMGLDKQGSESGSGNGAIGGEPIAESGSGKIMGSDKHGSESGSGNGTIGSKQQTRTAAKRRQKASVTPKTYVMKEDASIYLVKNDGELVKVVVNEGVGTVMVSNATPDYFLNASKKKYVGEGCGFKNKEDKNAFFIKVDEGFKCSSCNIVMKRIGDIKVHIRTHTGETPYVCEICAKTFTRSSYLTDHMKIHQKSDADKVRQHSCHFCVRRYFHREHLKRHLVVVHGHKKDIAIDDHDVLSHACHLCDRCFGHPNHLKQHLEVHSRNINLTPVRLSCDRCKATFCKRYALKSHMNAVHLKRKQYTCVLCKKGFCTRSEISRHIASHRKDKTWSCPQCVNKYIRNYNLQTHMKQHDKGMCFCTKCGRKFTNELSMQEHLESCVGMTYDCNHCHETYHTLESYQAHVDQLIAECSGKESDTGVVMKLDEDESDNDSSEEERPIVTRATSSKPRLRKTATRCQRMLNASDNASDGDKEKDLHVTRSTRSKPRMQNAATGRQKMIASKEGSATELHVIGKVTEMSEVDTATSIIHQQNASKVAPPLAPLEIVKMDCDEKQTFMTNIALKDHGAYAQESVHRCAVCDTSFPSESDKAEHEISEHEDDVTFMCCFCDCHLLTKAKLFEHCAEDHELEMALLRASNEPLKFLLSEENNRMVLKLSTSAGQDGVPV